MSTRQILNKIEQTVAVLATPVLAVYMIWFNTDMAVYTEATAGLIISICEYIKLFLKDSVLWFKLPTDTQRLIDEVKHLELELKADVKKAPKAKTKKA